MPEAWIEPFLSTPKISAPTTSHPLSKQLGVYPLYRAVLNISKQSPFAKPLAELREKVEGALKDRTEAQLLELSNICYELVCWVNEGAGSMEGNKLMELARLQLSVFAGRHVGITKQTETFHKISRNESAYLKEISLLIVKKYERKDYLFLDFPSVLMAHLSEDDEKSLDMLRSWLLSRGQRTGKKVTRLEAQRWYDVVESVTEVLIQPCVKNLLKTSQHLTGKSLRSILATDFHVMTTGGTISSSELDKILPITVKSEHYVEYMRKIHELYGELMVRLHVTQPTGASEGGQEQLIAYMEKIPKEVRLDDSPYEPAIVPLPASLEDDDQHPQTMDWVPLSAQEHWEPSPASAPPFSSEHADLTEATIKRTIVPMANLGNTCWLNAVVHCLSNIKPLRQYLTSLHCGDDHDHEEADKAMNNHKSLLYYFKDLLNQLWQGSQGTIVVPTEFRAQLAQRYPQYRGYSMHDCHEFLTVLLTDLANEDKFFSDLFHINGKQSTRCTVQLVSIVAV